MPTIESGLYLGGYVTTAQVDGQPLEVTVHFARVRGGVACVGLDVRSFTAAATVGPPEPMSTVLPVGVNLTKITSSVIRGVQTAQVIDAAAAGLRAGILDAVEGRMEDRAQTDATAGVPADDVRPRVEKFLDQPVRRRGPDRQLSDTVLRDVVARAYLDAARKPAQAVRDALKASELTRHIFKGRVSDDQARKAVGAARRRGFIPPATLPRQHREEEA